MKRTKNGNGWHFGMKAHIAVATDSGLVHTVNTTPVNELDITQAHALVHSEEVVIFGDSEYFGADRREDNQDIRVIWHVAMKPSQRRTIMEKGISKAIERIEKLKAAVRAKVEHPLRFLKCQFGYRKVRYKGLAKNTGQILTLFTLISVWIGRKKLMTTGYVLPNLRRSPGNLPTLPALN